MHLYFLFFKDCAIYDKYFAGPAAAAGPATAAAPGLAPMSARVQALAQAAGAGRGARERKR